MKGRKIIVTFFLLLLTSTFSFSYFSVSTFQFVEIAEEESRHSNSSSVSFVMQEYIIADEESNLFFSAIDLKHYFQYFFHIPPLKEVIAPPPELA
ncbi:MAG TPA: hypothetical protein VKZ45_10600 [Vicingaceae bacterium]|nr:hypothetical protein [Vicingaceae bacterium]